MAVLQIIRHPGVEQGDFCALIRTSEREILVSYIYANARIGDSGYLVTTSDGIEYILTTEEDFVIKLEEYGLEDRHTNFILDGDEYDSFYRD